MRDITVIPRAVITAAFGVVHTVERAVGAGPIRTAQDNAWEAVCADRALARQRDEIRRAAAALHHATPQHATVGAAGHSGTTADHSSVGSSPRSRAAQA